MDFLNCKVVYQSMVFTVLAFEVIPFQPLLWADNKRLQNPLGPASDQITVLLCSVNLTD